MNPRYHIIRKYNIKTDVIEIPNAGRDDLAELLHELDFQIGVEVGVAAGEYSEILMRANPQMMLYGVDPYVPYRGYRDYTRNETFDRLRTDAHNRLNDFSNYKFIETYSMEAAKRFDDNSLDFVYLDGNHSDPYVTQDIEAWYPKVRPGGIMAGHDYARISTGNEEGDSKNWAVIPAVKKFATAQELELFIWGLEAKLPGLVRDASRSWMVCK